MHDISIFLFFRIARKRFLPLLIALVVAAGLTFSYCEFVASPVYGANASIIVTNGAVVSSTNDLQDIQKILGSDIQASLLLADSVVDMLKTPDVYKYLSRKLGSDIDYNTLMTRTTVARRGDDTLFVDISYKDTDPKQAIRVANMFASISCDYVAEFIPKANPKVVSSADKARLVSPRTLRNTALAGLGVAFLLYCVFVLIEILNDTVRGEDDFTSRYNIPLLGSVPDFEEARKAKSGGKGRYY